MQNEATQTKTEKRRSERILQELLIRVAWRDSRGKGIRVNTRTVNISRYGAKIILNHELAAGQEINVYCLITEREGKAQIIGRTEVMAKGHFYGIEFVDQENNLWNIPFRLFFDALE